MRLQSLKLVLSEVNIAAVRRWSKCVASPLVTFSTLKTMCKACGHLCSDGDTYASCSAVKKVATSALQGDSRVGVLLAVAIAIGYLYQGPPFSQALA